MTLKQLSRRSAARWQPHAYQRRAVKFLLEHAAGALFLDPGLGKTSVTLGALKILFKLGQARRVLVVAPLRPAQLVWPGELEKWADFHHLRLVVLHGPRKEALLAEDADIFVINPEGLEWLFGLEKWKNTRGKTAVRVDEARFRKLGFDTLVIDELSKFKNSQSNRAKAMRQVLSRFARRWGLTGSPAANGLMGLFGQMLMIDEGHALGRYITHYRASYFVPARDGFSYELAEGGEARIHKAIAPLVLRMSARDYLELPERVENNLYVELPSEAKRVYVELLDELVVAIEQRTVVAANAGAAISKCRQVASGGLYYDPSVTALVRAPRSAREVIQLHDAKTDALEELVDELQGEPLLVAYDFHHDLERLRARFGKLAACFDDVKTARQAIELEHRWNAGAIPLLLAHPASVGHGLNLQGACHHVAWYTLTYDYELYDQFIKRVERQGNKAKRVFVHHLLARGSLDEVVLEVLKAKAHGQQALFTALQRLQRRPYN